MGMGMGQMFANMQRGMQGGAQAAPAQESQGSRHCVHCGAALTAKAKFCPECGKPVEADVCPKCGAKLPAKGKFCPECGTKIR